MKNELILIYDYDGTLAPGSIQEPYLIPLLMPELSKVEDFWKIPNSRAQGFNYDSNIMYMKVILEKAKEKNIPLTMDFLRICGTYSKNFPGVEEWFSRINAYAKEKDVIVKHYLVSSGNEELLVGTKIAKYFTKIHACKFYFENDVATDIGYSLNDHAKTKFIDDIRIPDSDEEDINLDDHKKIPFANMVYIGDGLTDVPAMKEIISKGGLSFAVYSNEKGEKRVEEFKRKNLVNDYFSAKRCYLKHSKLEKEIFKKIDRLSLLNQEDAIVQLNIFDFIENN